MTTTAPRSETVPSTRGATAAGMITAGGSGTGTIMQEPLPAVVSAGIPAGLPVGVRAPRLLAAWGGSQKKREARAAPHLRVGVRKAGTKSGDQRRTRMRKLVISMSVILFLPAMLAGQSTEPRGAVEDNGGRATLFGGYNYLRNNSNGFNGWQGQGTFNFSRHLGVTADISGDYRTPVSVSLLGVTASAHQRLYTYLFGPTVTANFGRS